MDFQGILKTVLYIFLLFLAGITFGKSAELPKCVRNAIRNEGIFAALIFLPAFLAWTAYDITIWSTKLLWIVFFNVLGLFWFVLVNYLFRGKKWARKTCLVLSIIRFFTILGIPFSLISLDLLREKEAKDFFDRQLSSSKKPVILCNKPPDNQHQ